MIPWCSFVSRVKGGISDSPSRRSLCWRQVRRGGTDLLCMIGLSSNEDLEPCEVRGDCVEAMRRSR